MIPERDEEKVWKCEKCGKKFSSASIDKIVMSLEEEKNKILSDPGRKTVKVIENFINKCMKVLDARNLIIIRLKYNLIGLYGRQPGYSTQVRPCIDDLKFYINLSIFYLYKIMFPDYKLELDN